MQRIKKICYAAALVFSATLMGRVAIANEPPPQQPDQPTESPPPKPSDTGTKPYDTSADTSGSKTMAQKENITATVQKIDMKHRKVMLKDDQGQALDVEVPEDVKGLDQIKKGDKVSIDYYSSMVLSIAKPGTKLGASTTNKHERNAGELPGGMMAKEIKATVEVVKADTSNNKLTIRTPSGDLDTINVTDPSMQSDLSKIKKGDKIQVNYTEAVAISVTPQNDTNKSG